MRGKRSSDWRLRIAEADLRAGVEGVVANYSSLTLTLTLNTVFIAECGMKEADYPGCHIKIQVCRAFLPALKCRGQAPAPAQILKNGPRSCGRRFFVTEHFLNAGLTCGVSPLDRWKPLLQFPTRNMAIPPNSIRMTKHKSVKARPYVFQGVRYLGPGTL